MSLDTNRVFEGPFTPDRCPLCGGQNQCPLASGDAYRGKCWCERIDIPQEVLDLVPEDARRLSCVCSACVEAAFRRRPLQMAGPGDYYVEAGTGKMVFLAEYHLRRGYCCDSKCRHCPWRAPSNAVSLVMGLIALLLFSAFGGHGPNSSACADTWLESFDADPFQHGWSPVGDASLFWWDSTKHNLQVLWDTSRAQSFFAHDLNQVLTSQDDFGFALDLELGNVQPGVSTNRPGAMQISFGLLNLSRAAAMDSRRAAGKAADLLEFDWFPPGIIPGFGAVEATVSAIAFGSSGTIATSFTYPLSLLTGVVYRVSFDYHATNRHVDIHLMQNGLSGPPLNGFELGSDFGDFHADSFAIMVWNELSSPFDSLKASGCIDNIELTLPPAPIGQIEPVAGQPGSVQFQSRTGWQYQLESSWDLKSWLPLGEPVAGTGSVLVLVDPTGGTVPLRLYRVRATRS